MSILNEGILIRLLILSLKMFYGSVNQKKKTERDKYR